jgi:hypothetical protein
LIPLITVSAVAPSYIRPLIMASSIFSSAVRTALRAIDHIAAAAKGCVAERSQQLLTGVQTIRCDLLQQLFDISNEKGEKVDFGLGEITYEAYVGLCVTPDLSLGANEL